jgi:MFS family permease
MLAHFAHHLMMAQATPLLPFIRNDFRLDYTKSALVISAFNLSNGIGQLPGGWLADRIGTRVLITVGICGVALAGALVGLSQTYLMMIVFLVLMGLLAGGYHPSATPLVSASVEPENRGSALGFHEIGAAASLLMTPLIAANIAAAWGWRSSYISLAIPTIIFGIILYVLLRKRLQTSVTRPGVPDRHAEEPLPKRRWYRLVVFMILVSFSGAAIASATAFVPLYMVDHLGASERAAASFISIQFFAGLWASPVGGYLSDRLGRLPVILASHAIASISIYLLNMASYGLSIGALLLFIGIAIFIRMPVAEAYILGHTTERNRSTVYGIYYFSMTETNAIFAPVMGYLIDRFGFYSSFSIISASIVAVTLICLVFLWRIKD